MSNIYDLSDTWNDAGVAFDAVKMNVTNAASAAESNLVNLQVGGTVRFRVRKDGAVYIAPTAALDFGVNVANNFLFTISGGYGLAIGSAGPNATAYNFASFPGGTIDTRFTRVGAGVLGLRDATTGGAALNFVEQTAPGAPATNQVVIYAEDNGGGKTRLMARFATGAAQQIAIEP